MLLSPWVYMQHNILVTFALPTPLSWFTAQHWPGGIQHNISLMLYSTKTPVLVRWKEG
jgi:hypothetical protein